MDEQVVNVLKQIKAEHGVEIFLNRSRFNALLKDYAKAQFKGEIRLLTTALDEGLFSELLNAPEDFPQIRVRYMLKLKSELFWTDNQAVFVIDTWAAIVGIKNMDITTITSFCIYCGNSLDNDAKFCCFCGSPVNGEPRENTLETKQSFDYSIDMVQVTLRYEKSALLFLLGKLDVLIDGNLHFVVPENGNVQIMLPRGRHLYEAYCIYMNKYGKVRKLFDVTGNYTTITYRPPAAIFLEGIVIINSS